MTRDYPEILPTCQKTETSAMPIRTEPEHGIQKSLDQAAADVVSILRQRGDVLVAAESCTAGLIAATLARVPGVSSFFAGSMVVYQVASKSHWLGIEDSLIHKHDVVSSEIARAMAEQVLARTPHASVSIGITGHLGPEAPKELDGTAWLGFALRGTAAEAVRLSLRTLIPLRPASELSETQRLAVRHDRQKDAVLQSLNYLTRKLHSASP
ncbi:MAG: CinA family protein [Planctomycetota bacterium]